MIKVAVFFLICFILLFLSAFFSSSETALFSLSEPEIQNLKTIDRKRKYLFDKLLMVPHDLLITVLLSNTVVNVTLSFIITLVFLEFVPNFRLNVRFGMFLNTVLIATILLIFGEFTPKFYALRRKMELSRNSVIPLYYLTLFLRPFVFFFNFLNRLIISRAKDRIKEEISYSELKTLFEISEKEGVINGKEKEIIKSLFTLTESVVSEIMVPRTKIFSISGDMTVGEVHLLLLKKPYSRVPVYSKDEEKIEGILYLKDLLIHRKEKKSKINTILRDALFVPEKMKLKDLFLEFRKKRVHFAIVVNEFGGVEGVVTMNDILEEIVGSIRDEYHKGTSPLYRYISKDEILVNGELKINDFPTMFYKRFPHGDYETISGFILSNLGRLPEEDESFVFRDLTFTVVKLDGRKLDKIIIRKRSGQGRREANRHKYK